MYDCSKNMKIFIICNFLLIVLLLFPRVYKIFLQHPQIKIEKDLKDNLVLGDKSDNLFHFVHISDTHYSIYVPERKTNFENFLTQMKDVIKPELIINTGDLTDNEGNPLIWRVQQYEKEWKDYQDSLSKFSHVFNETNYHDIRGNHDGYGEVKNGNETMYYKYSMSGKNFFRNNQESRLYEFTHRKPFGKYRFIGMDSYVNVTTLRPYHFFGQFEGEWVDQLKNKLKNTESNHTILYGHYSFNTLYSYDFQSTIDLMSLSRSYKFICNLFGHLHNTYGFVPNGVQTKFDNGHLELEVLDYKSHHMYRVLAYDHDILSFIDIEINKYPVILITNPKNCRFLSELEPLHRMTRSTHIRIMILSPTRVQKVNVYIDGKEIGEAQNVRNSNLYVLRWIPERYSKGVHKIIVRASADGNLNNFVEQEFSLDGTIPPPQTIDQYKSRLLLLPLNVVFQMLYISMLLPIISLLSVYSLVSWMSDDYQPKEYIFNQFLKLARYYPLTHFFLLSFGFITILLMYRLYLFGILWMIGTYGLMTLYFAFVAKEPNDPESRAMIIAHFISLLYSIVRIIDMLYVITLWKLEEMFFPNGLEFFIICIIFIMNRLYLFISSQ